MGPVKAVSAGTPKVRGHHLLCLLTYVGRGYSAAFVSAMDALAAHVAQGKTIEVCAGPDVLCAVLQQDAAPCAGHCTLARNRLRDTTALDEIAALTDVACFEGMHLDSSVLDFELLRATLQRLDRAASLDGLRRACRGCEWLNLCRAVTSSNFAQVKLPTDAAPNFGASRDGAQDGAHGLPSIACGASNHLAHRTI